MESTPIQIGRQALYERVWTTPITALAKAYGISDVGLAKTCKRHNIPRPARGHWAKLAVGRPPARPPLPDGADILITIGEGKPYPQPPDHRSAVDGNDSARFDSDIQRLIATSLAPPDMP